MSCIVWLKKNPNLEITFCVILGLSDLQIWWSEIIKWDIMETRGRGVFFWKHWVETKGSFLCIRKSLSWHTALRIRRKSEKRDKEGRKMENGYRKSQDSLANKVSVKVDGRKITSPTWLTLAHITWPFLFHSSFWIPISFPMVGTHFNKPLEKMLHVPEKLGGWFILDTILLTQQLLQNSSSLSPM